MTNPNLARVTQSPTPGDIVSLFRLDTSLHGGGIYYFAQGAWGSSGVTFGGQYYTPIDVEFEGFETNGTGSLPTPKMRLANSDMTIQNMINAWGDLLGSELRRVRTFSRFLDGQPEADPTAYFGPDVFRIERKTDENPVFVEWELSASIDQEGKMLPGRVVIRDTCLWRYRRWTGSAFDYTKTSCQWAGSDNVQGATEGPYFDFLDQPTNDPAKDACGRRLSSCQARFGSNKPLPFGGFPGVARVR